MKKILIDGSFVAKKVTGVQRFNWEILKRLVTIPDLKIYLAISENTDLSNFNIDNIEIIKVGKKINKYWQLFTLGKISKKFNIPLLCMSNFSPLFTKDYVVLHDVTFLDKDGKNRFLWSIAHRILIGFHFSKHKKIFTVSEFSKERILYHYKNVKQEQVEVVYSGGEHWNNIGIKKPYLKHLDNFFLSVGSTTPNKNFEYIIKLAERNPNKQFIVVGRIDGAYEKITEKLDNIEFAGYLENEELHYLYKNCKGFILPSFYEGFGLPPLEALNCGCRCLVLSDIAVFREIYGKVANFFDPYDYKNLIDLDLLTTASVTNIDHVLKLCNWESTAKKIYNCLED